MDFERADSRPGAVLSGRPPRPIPATTFRRRALPFAVMLLISAVLFAGLIVVRRDARARDDALVVAHQVQSWLQTQFDHHSYLPAQLSTDASPQLSKADLVDYPSLVAIRRLRDQNGPFILWCGPRRGLIMPGTDGAAAVFFEDGKLSVRWISPDEAQRQRKQREKLAATPPDSR